MMLLHDLTFLICLLSIIHGNSIKKTNVLKQFEELDASEFAAVSALYPKGPKHQGPSSVVCYLNDGSTFTASTLDWSNDYTQHLTQCISNEIIGYEYFDLQILTTGTIKIVYDRNSTFWSVKMIAVTPFIEADKFGDKPWYIFSSLPNPSHYNEDVTMEIVTLPTNESFGPINIELPAWLRMNFHRKVQITSSSSVVPIVELKENHPMEYDSWTEKNPRLEKAFGYIKQFFGIDYIQQQKVVILFLFGVILVLGLGCCYIYGRACTMFADPESARCLTNRPPFALNLPAPRYRR